MKFPKKLFSEEEKDTMIDEVNSFIETNNKWVRSKFRQYALMHPITRLGRYFYEVLDEKDEFFKKIYCRKGTVIMNEAEFKAKLDETISLVPIAD